jgi:hypothetical protein
MKDGRRAATDTPLHDMNWLRKKKPVPLQLSRDQALRCSPFKNPAVEETRLENGLVQITYPLHLKPFLADVAKRFGLWKDGDPPKKQLQLDEMGTYSWDLMNGKRSVARMASLFAERYKLHPKEAEVSMTAFLRELGKRGLVGMKE